MTKDRDAYVVIAPTGKSKIYSVACRKIGSRDRYTVIATCQHEVTADSIVDGLKLLQGEKVKLEMPAQLTINDLRVQLNDARKRADDSRTEKQSALNRLSLANESIERLGRERDAAQKRARETA